MKNALAIPVRINSSRLPNKALKVIHGKTLIQRVIEQCKKSDLPVYLITDSEEIVSSIDDDDIIVIFQEKDAESGTERIANAASIIDADYIINVQGDQPFISPEAINEMNSFIINKPTHDIVTPIKIYTEKYSDPSKCKVVVDINGRAIYFSRSPIPYNADYSYGHLGMYGYKKDVLLNFHKLKTSPLEKMEKLEQLKFIDNGIPIQTYETSHSIFSIDTQSDLVYAIEHFSEFV